MTKIQVGTIISNEDGDRQGLLFVAVDNQKDILTVFYVTPYGGNGTHGLYAIPEVGTQILITQPDNSNLWFYLGSIVKAHTDVPGIEGVIKESPGQEYAKELLPDKQIYKALGVPQRYGIKSPLGNRLILSDEHNKDYQNIYTKLVSSKGKTIGLIDSNGTDSVIIRNEHGDHIKISTTSNPSQGQAGRMIEVECTGPLRLISHEGTIDMRVVDGRDINIENTSTGSKKNPGNPDAFGNINIISKYKDVNIKVKGKDSKINIQAEGNNSQINVDSKGKLDIRSTKDLTLESDTNITVTAPLINLNP